MASFCDYSSKTSASPRRCRSSSGSPWMSAVCPVPMELDLPQGADLRGSDSVAMAGRGCVPFKATRDAVGGSVATQSESMTRGMRPFAPSRAGRSQGHRPPEIVRPTEARPFRAHQPGLTIVARQPQRDQLQWQHIKSNGTGHGHVIPQVGMGVRHVIPHPGSSRNSPWGRRCAVAWWVLLAGHADLRPFGGPDGSGDGQEEFGVEDDPRSG